MSSPSWLIIIDTGETIGLRRNKARTRLTAKSGISIDSEGNSEENEESTPTSRKASSDDDEEPNKPYFVSSIKPYCIKNSNLVWSTIFDTDLFALLLWALASFKLTSVCICFLLSTWKFFFWRLCKQSFCINSIQLLKIVNAVNLDTFFPNRRGVEFMRSGEVRREFEPRTSNLEFMHFFSTLYHCL